MTRIFMAFLALALMVPGTAAAQPAASGNQAVAFPYPSKAPIVVCLNGYDKARERLNKLLTAALPDEAPALSKALNGQLDKLLEGRKLTGVRKDARAFFVVNDLGGIVNLAGGMGGSIPASVIVPVTSYQEFRETFFTKDELKSFEKGREKVDSIKTALGGDEGTLYLVDLKEYVAASSDKAVADAYAAKYTAGSTEPMGAAAADAFLKSDVALFVNMDAINDQFGDQIRQLRGAIDLFAGQLSMQGLAPGLTKKQLEAMKTVLKGMFQGVEDCRAIVAGAEFRPEGLLMRLQTRFADNTPSARWVKSATSSPLKEIGKLPVGLSTYTESRFGGALGELLGELNQEFAVADDDEAAAGKLDEALKARAAAGPKGSWSAIKTPGTSINVLEFKEPAKGVKAMLDEYRSVPARGRITNVVIKAAPKVKEKAETHRGYEFAQVQLQYDFDATVAGLPEGAREPALEAMKKNSSEKPTLWIGTDGKQVIQLTAKDWPAAKAVLDEYLDGKSVGKEPAFAATLGQLPADASLLVVADTAATVHAFVEMAKTAMQSSPVPVPGLPNLGAVKPYNGPATYVGLAITMKGDSIGISGYIPTGAIAVTKKMIEGLIRNVE